MGVQASLYVLSTLSIHSSVHACLPSSRAICLETPARITLKGCCILAEWIPVEIPRRLVWTRRRSRSEDLSPSWGSRKEKILWPNKRWVGVSCAPCCVAARWVALDSRVRRRSLILPTRGHTTAVAGGIIERFRRLPASKTRTNEKNNKLAARPAGPGTCLIP